MSRQSQDKLYVTAKYLAIVTIIYNLVEGVVSVWLGASDETLALFGFGVDSFIEVISAVGIWHMLRRISQNGEETRDEFERQALRITGASFYLLTAGLVMTAIVDIWLQHKPDTTFWGIVVSLASIFFMWLLIHFKAKVGRVLDSPAILADVACSKTCLHLSLVLLLTSAGYELTGIGNLDAAGALLIGYLSWREGREAYGKAQGLSCSCTGGCG
jgi:divalent metal cation (Fe/Co/Zn/Cd) transporter